MKAVIVDLNGKDAVALRGDGRFEKIKNRNYSIGQEITLQSQTIRFPKQAAIAASAAIVIAACGGMGSYTWSNPISYVSLDINPSIAYSLNEFNRVIAVSGMNDEGTAVVDAIGDSLKNTDITTALTITVEQLSTDAYLDAENTNYMVIGVYSDKDSKADALKSTVDEFTANAVETCSITTVNVSKETKESADSYGITGGKMELINEIANVATDPQEVDPAALADLTVAELEQTKSAAASGVSVTEAVAAVTPDEKEPATAEAPEPPVDPNAVASDSKPSGDVESTSSAKKDEPEEEKAPAENAPAADAEPSVPADTSGSDNHKVTGSATSADGNSDASQPASSSGLNADSTNKNPSDKSNSTDKNGNGASESKDDTSSSSSKGESTSSEKKGESSSSEKKDSSSSDKKEEVSEDSSQQTNSAPGSELLNDSETGISAPDNEILVCSMAI
ncbi:MAG: hypothetical protein MSA09_05520 [Lachnospiraceae bacterium]|nr:hypothetical protein [Lachnospiraceae bacterium]MDD7177180.1 hypothetical protein [bacterium]MDY5517141.1 hypothetical protein [Lachnospiraceae bacterium]